MTAEKRQTAYARRLRVGDFVHDSDGFFEVTRKPEVISVDEVKVYLKPVGQNRSRATSYLYGINDRVNVVSPGTL